MMGTNQTWLEGVCASLQARGGISPVSCGSPSPVMSPAACAAWLLYPVRSLHCVPAQRSRGVVVLVRNIRYMLLVLTGPSPLPYNYQSKAASPAYSFRGGDCEFLSERQRGRSSFAPFLTDLFPVIFGRFLLEKIRTGQRIRENHCAAAQSARRKHEVDPAGAVSARPSGAAASACHCRGLA